jgi:hypothetical protein
MLGAMIEADDRAAGAASFALASRASSAQTKWII